MSEEEHEHTEEEIQELVEVLRTSCGHMVFAAFNHAPSENLKDMKDMIEHILDHREKEHSDKH